EDEDEATAADTPVARPRPIRENGAVNNAVSNGAAWPSPSGSSSTAMLNAPTPLDTSPPSRDTSAPEWDSTPTWDTSAPTYDPAHDPAQVREGTAPQNDPASSRDTAGDGPGFDATVGFNAPA